MAHRYSRVNDIDNLNDTLVYGSGVNKIKGLGSLVLKTLRTLFQTQDFTVAMGKGSDEPIRNQRISNEGKLEVVINKDQENCKIQGTCKDAEMHKKVTVRGKFNWIRG